MNTLRTETNNLPIRCTPDTAAQAMTAKRMLLDPNQTVADDHPVLDPIIASKQDRSKPLNSDPWWQDDDIHVLGPIFLGCFAGILAICTEPKMALQIAAQIWIPWLCIASIWTACTFIKAFFKKLKSYLNRQPLQTHPSNIQPLKTTQWLQKATSKELKK